MNSPLLDNISQFLQFADTPAQDKFSVKKKAENYLSVRCGNPCCKIFQA